VDAGMRNLTRLVPAKIALCNSDQQAVASAQGWFGDLFAGKNSAAM